MESLFRFGWGSAFADSSADPSLVPARVLAHGGEAFTLITPTGEVSATLSGRVQYSATSPLDLPTVGDWVGARGVGDHWFVDHVFARRTSIVRKKAGRGDAPQLIAANVDVAFVVTAATSELKPNRLLRYLVAIRAGGVEPVILLNKVDLAEDLPALLRSMPPGVAVHPVCARTGEGMEAIALSGHRTYVFVGSSGVGKSTIVNRLLEAEVQVVEGLARDDTGRHTTTHRALFPVPGRDALVIDTPGMRELGLWADGGIDETFEDVVGLAQSCRFRDCGHETEPGCAVVAAIEGGELDALRLKAWRKLQREIHRVDTAIHVRRAEIRAFSKRVKQNLKHRG